MKDAMAEPIPPPDPPPHLRVHDCPLPPYRFVPGLNPHPFRHPDGHMYTDGSAPAEETWDPAVPWENDRAWLRGMDLFDHRYFWEAHEAWEAIWHSVPRDDPYAQLLQGLIQAAAFLLKQHMGHEAAAARLQRVCLGRLEDVQKRCGSPWRGVDLEALTRRLDPPTRPTQDQSDSDPTP